MKKIFLFSFLFISFGLFSQDASEMIIQGKLLDTAKVNGTPKGLKDAVLYLVNIDDSSFVDRILTKDDGQFHIQKPFGTYQLFISHPRFNEQEYFFISSPETNYFDLGAFTLPEKSEELKEITIFAYKDPVYYKGDTLIYTADSFKVKPNAVVEDLLKKLPGVEVDKDGKIKVQGKDVARVLVDGDEFFGSDPTMATKNLAAGSIENVKVYEKQLDDALATDDKVQVIDLTLKDDAKKGYFGKLDFATDFMKYYEGEALFNYFTSKLKFSVYGLTTNTTKTSLDWQDANQFGIEMSGSRTYTNETDSRESYQNVVTSEGYPLMFKTGAFYNHKINKKLELGANYTYTNYRVEKGQESFSQYFLEDTVYYQQNNQTNELEHQKHEANLKIKWNIDSTQSLEILPQFKAFETNSILKTEQDYISDIRDTMRKGSTLNNNQQEGNNFKAKITYIKDFQSKKRRKLILMDNFTMDNFDNTTQLGYEDFLPTNNAYLNLIDQHKTEDRAIISNLINARYTEPFGKNWAMEFGYENFNIKNNRITNSYNKNGDVYDILDSLTSNDFQSIKYQNIGEIAGVFDNRKWKITLGTKVRNVITDNDNRHTNQNIHQNITSPLPYFNVEYKFSQASKIVWSNRTYSTLPDINQLQPVYDNSNPNSIQVGNENLLPTYSISSSLTYNNYMPVSSIWIYSSLNAVYTKNDFAQNIYYDSIGRSVSEYKNIDMFNYVSFWGGFGFPIYQKILFMGPRLSYNYSNRYSYINNDLVKNNSNTPGIDLVFRGDGDKMDGSISLGYKYNKVTNGINAGSNQSNHIYTISGEYNYEMPLKFLFSVDWDFYIMKGLSKGYDNNTFILNASVGKKFFKHDQLRVDFIVNDILNQNKSVNRMTAMNIITDTRKMIITRYFLLKLTYQFNSTFKLKKQKDSETQKDSNNE